MKEREAFETIYENNAIRNVQITYTRDGSRGWARTFIIDLVIGPRMKGTIRLYDIDTETTKANGTIRNHLPQRKEAIDRWIYRTCMNMEEALTGADFVTISTLPGTFGEMVVDVHISGCPGICQSIGDTARPGSVIRALRTIPIYVESTKTIRQYVPDAWVINYTNPMSLYVKTLYHVSPQVRVSECCHEVFGTQKILKEIAEDVLGLKHIDREDAQVGALGIDYFTWLDYASYRGIDLFPMYGKYMGEYPEENYAGRDANRANACFACTHGVKSDLLRRCGLIAATRDRRLAEFMPGNKYLKDPEIVGKWRFTLTSAD